jgi:hypothetical protein
VPLPDATRTREYLRKGLDLVERQFAVAPEQRASRHLAARAPDTAGSRPRVLVFTPRDWAAHVQYDAVIAHALRLRGADVRFLTCGGDLEICDRANRYEAPPMPCTTCRRYVDRSIEAHRFPFARLREFWRDAALDDWPDLDSISYDDLQHVEWDGLPLGHVVDIPVKWFLCAASVDEDPLAGAITRSFLRSARRIAVGVARALDDTQPDVVMLLNGLFLFEAVAWAECRRRGIDVVTYERAFRKETLVFSRGVPAGFYDFSASWPLHDRALTPEEEAELSQYLAERRHGAAFDQYWRFQSTAGDRPRDGARVAVLFTNLTWDTAVVGKDIAFPDIRSWLDAAIALFARRPDDRLVIRIHPSEVHLPGKQTRDSLESYIRSRHPTLPPNVSIVGAADAMSSYDLIDRADVGLVYTSTTGLELALAGKPVVVAGEVHYRGKGFTIDVDTPAAFADTVAQCLDERGRRAPDVDAARRYAHFFFFRAPIAAPIVREPVPGLARLEHVSIDDLRPGGDPHVDQICATILDGHVG